MGKLDSSLEETSHERAGETGQSYRGTCWVKKISALLCFLKLGSMKHIVML